MKIDEYQILCWYSFIIFDAYFMKHKLLLRILALTLLVLFAGTSTLTSPDHGTRSFKHTSVYHFTSTTDILPFAEHETVYKIAVSFCFIIFSFFSLHVGSFKPSSRFLITICQRNWFYRNITINAPSMRLVSTVPIALPTNSLLSRNASISTPSGKVFSICFIRSFTLFTTALEFSPFSIRVIAPTTSPLSLYC